MTAAEDRAARPLAGLVPAVGVATTVIVLDQLTKWWAESRLSIGPCSPETCIDVVGPLRFHLSYNTGVSFGVADGSGLGWLIGVVATAVAVWLLLVARRSAPGLAALLGVVAGGAIGNVIDRLVRAEDGFGSGGVVDFIDFQFFPIFNVADIAVVGGVIALAVAPWLFGTDPAALLGEAAEEIDRETSDDVEDGVRPSDRGSTVGGDRGP